jgi:antitoxin HicB
MKPSKTTTRNPVHDSPAESSDARLQFHMSVKYPIELVEDDGAYIARNPDLSGCFSYGDTPDEAVENLAKTRALWLAGQIETGQAIPEPAEVCSYSGKFVLRIPKLLHQTLDRQAKQQGVSLNQFISTMLAGSVSYGQQGSSLRASEQLNYVGLWRERLHDEWAGSGWNIVHLGGRPAYLDVLSHRSVNQLEQRIGKTEFEDYFHAEEELTHA